MGKTAACYFFMQEKNFFPTVTLLPVKRVATSVITTIGGKSVELIDMPGVLDPGSIGGHEYIDFVRGLIKIKSGFHVLCVVFSISNRLTTREHRQLKNLLCKYEHYLPYVVLLFTHGKMLGDTEDKRKSELRDMLEEVEEMTQILEKINNRYIILESVEPMEQGYHAYKSKELIGMIDTIFKQTGKPATNDFALSLAENHRKLKDIDETVLETELVERIKAAQEMMKKYKSDNFFPYLKYAIIIGGGILATLLPVNIRISASVIKSDENCVFQ